MAHEEQLVLICKDDEVFNLGEEVIEPGIREMVPVKETFGDEVTANSTFSILSKAFPSCIT